MGFFFHEDRAQTKQRAPRKARLEDIPVQSLQRLGCSVCPRDKDGELRTPKMAPVGPERASVYLLSAQPSERDDSCGEALSDQIGREVLRSLGSDFVRRHVRQGFVQQCAGEQTHVELECCRPRVLQDIERVRPEVVVGIGDVPLRWAVGDVGSALVNRGELFVARFGSHVCWYYCMLTPVYALRKGPVRSSEYQLAMQHDAERLRGLVGSLRPPKLYDRPYDGGIELITGQEAGDMQRLEEALHALAREPRSAVDIETTGLRPYMLRDARILTCAVGTFSRAVAFAVDHEDGWGASNRVARVKGLLLDYLRESGRKAAHNLAMEMEWFEHEYGPELLRRTEWDDTMAMCHTLNEGKGTKSLDYQTRKRFGFFLKDQSRVDVGRERWWTQYPLREILRYNGMDAKWTDLLRDELAPDVRAENQAEYERKVRLAPALVVTETRGLCVDMPYAEAQKTKLLDMIDDLGSRLRRLPEVRRYEDRFGRFAPSNPDHVLRLFRDVEPRDEVRVEERDGTVRWTTEEEALAKMRLPSADMILEIREVEKLLGTYVENVVSRKIVCRDGKIRCKYSSMVAVTGRLASEDPNAQNWPKRTALGRETRGIIVSPRGHVIAPLDYGQIEFRVIGMASEDRNLVKYCWTNYDVHGHWAQRMVDEHPRVKDWIVDEFKVDWDEKGLKTLRQESKNGWVFPMFFGSATRSCAQRMHLPDDVAEDLAREFWDEFRGVKRWQDRLLQQYERDLYVTTLGGRKRRGAMSKNEIINMPIQGTAGDIVNESLCALSEKAELDDDPCIQPVLDVHDDLTFYIPDELVAEKLPLIATEMCRHRFPYINVPLVVEASLGLRWNSTEEVKKYRSDELFGIPNPYK